ncbi:MAG: carbohydrate binding family 9 domain-containing protein [Gemmatimonadota bacterium]|nr:carbohydrate binding family 9 domain-containing protein [Gemmatimonadota bacterium]
MIRSLPVLGAAITFSVAIAATPALAQLDPKEALVEEASEGSGVRLAPGASTAAGPLDSSTDLADIQIDGVADEPDWASARVFSGFTQREPVEGVAAEHDTEVRVLFGDEAIWVAARMWDDDPTSIDRRLTRRDNHGTYDQFSIHLDPNLDGLTGYSFRVSAANVQGDTYFHSDDQMDFAWDAVWTSAVAIDDEGWSVEMRIPLSQIRYEASDDLQTWGVNFHRFRVANNERSYYSLVSRLRKGIVSQMGRLDNVQVSRPSRRLELLPYVVTSYQNGPAEPGDPFFDGSAAGSRVGLDMSYGLGSSFTLDATINPDFGQVEADPAVINLTAFETFFPEQRPFFVEDARVFDFSLSGRQNTLFYSRRIGRAPHGGAPGDAEFADVPSNATILGAAKLAGRTQSGLSLGALAAVTGNEFGRGLYSDATRSRFLVEPRTQFGVVSVGQDVNDGQTQVRGMVTAMNRELPADGTFDWLPSSAFNGGVRFEHQWDDRNYAVWGFFSGSYVNGSAAAMERIQRSPTHFLQRPDATRFSVDPTKTSLGGRDWRLQVEKRNGEHWTASIWAAEVSKLFEVNDVGFSTNAERLDGGFRVGYKEITPGRVFRDYNVTLSSFHNWSHEALDDAWSIESWHKARTSGNYSLSANGTFLNNWGVRSSVRYSPQTMDRRNTRGGPMMVGPANVNYNVNLNSDRRRRLGGSVNVDVTDDLLGRGGGFKIGGQVSVRPSDNVSVSVNPQWETSTSGDQYVTATTTMPYAPTFGARYLFADLDRTTFSVETRLDWTFTPKLSLQLFAQPLLSSGDYLQYKQLSESQSFAFDRFTPGAGTEVADDVVCTGTICQIGDAQHVDFDGDGVADYAFSDRDFNVRSLIGNAVLRWEYRPGSTIFFVWQRQQVGRTDLGDFDFGRDWDALWAAPAENRFIIKMNYWLGL